MIIIMINENNNFKSMSIHFLCMTTDEYGLAIFLRNTIKV